MAAVNERTRSTWARLAPALAALLLQVGVAPQISILGGRFNFLAALACALAPGLAPGRAALVGFACGIAFDLTASTPVGLTSLVLTVACFAIATSTQGMPLGLTAAGVRLTGLGILAAELASGLGLFLMGVEGSLVTAILSHGLVSAALTLLAALPLLMIAPTGDTGRGFSARSRGGTRYKVLR
ncbi:MAG: rod shape-determining protein MreD [Collinsella sp.]|nr:rod shape-determining protein MreD [Collinsella sp.]